jgi:hypothetical protein
MMKIFQNILTAICLLGLVWAPATFAGDSPDLEVIHRIREEAFKRSQVMEHLFYMTEVAGPRLTNSPGYRAAAEKIVEQAKAWGLENVALEPWEPFGRGWSNSYFSAHMTAPQYSPLIGLALSWTPGTDGVVSGTPILAIFNERDTDELRELEFEHFKDTWRGKLLGRIVMIDQPVHLEPSTEAANKRFSRSELSERTEMRDPMEPIEIDFENPMVPENEYDQQRFWSHAPSWLRRQLRESRRELRDQLHQFLVEEGVKLVVRAPWRGDGGTIFPPRGGRHDAETPVPPAVVLATEHYNRLARLLKKGLEPQLQIEVRSAFHQGEPTNVVAELLGGTKQDELVIIGAHLDDVVYATGATDNAAGCAVMMEAMRILKTLDLDMDRTVRMVLWGGEEQGLLGSRAYVKKHFGDHKTMVLKPDHGKVSAYFNVDNGGGKLRGIYLQNNDMVGPIFSSWLSPFHNLGASSVTIRNTGGTDHQSFDAVGIPGFQFIQDPLEYNTRTHHSNMDVYDRVVASDLMQASAIVAAFVYNTANREELLPRKPLPEPWPESAQEDAD